MNNIEKIEYLKGKGNISYEEANKLLEANDGDVIKVLCEMEKQGLLSEEKNKKKQNNSNKQSNNKQKNNSNNKKQEESKQEKTFGDSLKELFNKGNENRLVIKRDNDLIANISINYTILFIILAPHLSIVTVILILLLGYKIRFKKDKKYRSSEKVNDFVEKAKKNVKKSVESIVEEEIEEDTEDDDENEVTIED
ncbi:uncharacterized protein DUF4342 [Natranaerovirga hydrolytica]|uniref:Uncharacterized protein DUF4342 n=1 Tax=Natranaerovirga hydrolytica TaxID=680378 RepID=A0A4V2Q1Q1_9FIRM|nr:DUF4342 domain-containing protein [Natranaerovirga hydrolytica]TCK98471.1 uncharacterized protein DUF4342 [Natranaerovirga hydrolytica]